MAMQDISLSDHGSSHDDANDAIILEGVSWGGFMEYNG